MPVNPKTRIIFLVSIFALLSAIAIGQEVTILPLTGGVGTAKITPGNGSATAYRMDFRGQKAICFQSAASTDFFLSSATAIGADGWGFYNVGDIICADLASGTTLYFYGSGAGADCRAFFAK